MEPNVSDLDDQLRHAASIREFSYSTVEGEHKNNFSRKDYIGLSLFNRCLQTHEATEILVRKSLLDDAWVLVRVLVEHSVNSAYMLFVADEQTADDFADYPNVRRYEELQHLKSTNENLVRQIFSLEDEEKLRQRFEAARARFQNRRGDRWCADDRLYKRASRVDEKISEAMQEEHISFKWIVNSVWRFGGTYVHGAADALADQISETNEAVRIQRKYTCEEAAQVLSSANLSLFLILLLVDLRLGAKNAQIIKLRFAQWIGKECGGPPAASDSAASQS